MKSAIITGASRGIGKAIAIELAKTYDYIAICCLSHPELLQDVQQTVISSGCRCECFIGDVSDYSFVENMISSVINSAGSISVLINNAGISIVDLFTDMKPDDWSRIFQVNVNSVFNTCHQVVPHLLHKHSGSIINISSVWGVCGASCEVAYSATKGAINSFSMALGKELAPSNISVNAVAFGAIDTEMNCHLDECERKSLNEEIPFGRMATPEEAASFVSHLLDMPAYLTGQVIKFDGAWI